MAIHAKYDRFLKRASARVESLKIKTDGEGELDERDAALLSLVIEILKLRVLGGQGCW